MAEHARFHRIAAKIVERANEGGERQRGSHPRLRERIWPRHEERHQEGDQLEDHGRRFRPPSGN